VRFLHASDLHIDSPLRGLDRYEGAPVARLRTATRSALERLVDLAIPPRVLGLVMEWGEMHQAELMQNWTTLAKEGIFRRIAPLV
jgi:hypothetical protein